MRREIKDFIKITALSLPIQEPIYEFGSLQVPGQESYADLRPFFLGKEYVGCDYREGLGVDKVLDIHNIDLPSGSVGTVLSCDTFEHVEFPRRAMEEIHRILKPDGIAIICSVMDFPIHSFPYDYWRFTPEGFKSILKPFSDSFVGYGGPKKYPVTVLGIGFKGRKPTLSDFKVEYKRWQKQQKYLLVRFVKTTTPTILHPILKKVYRTYKTVKRKIKGLK